MINRRGFLQGILAAGMAPAIVKAEILMPVRKIIVPEWGTGIASLMQPWQQELNRFINPALIVADPFNLMDALVRHGAIKPGGVVHYDPRRVKTFNPTQLKGRA